MRTTHELKIIPKYFVPVAAGVKRFEIRKNDRSFQVGDNVLLREILEGEYTGQTLEVVITYITDYEQKDGYVVFGFEQFNEEC